MPPPGSHIFIYWFILKDHLFSLLNHLSVLPYQARAQFKHLPLCKPAGSLDDQDPSTPAPYDLCIMCLGENPENKAAFQTHQDRK